MKTIKLDRTVCLVEVATYSNNRIYLGANVKRTHEPYIDFTVNLIHAECGEKQAYIDTNNMSKAIYQTLITEKVINETPLSYAKSGFCTYPLHEILI